MHDLRRLAQPLFDAPPVAPTSVTELRRRARRRRNRRLGASALAVAAVVVASAAVVVSHGNSPKPSIIVSATSTTTTPTTVPSTTSPTTSAAPVVPGAVDAGKMGLISPGVGWAMNGIGLYVTVDDGAHWSNVTPPGAYDPLGNIDGLFFLDADHAWVEVSPNDQPGAIYRTADGGRTWQTACTGSACAAATAGMTFIDPQHGWAIPQSNSSGATVSATGDGGHTWTTVGTAPFSGPITFVDRDDGWGVSDPGDTDETTGTATKPGGALYRTTDGGATWQKVAVPAVLPGPVPHFGVPHFFGRDGVVPAYFPGTNAKVSSEVVVYTTADGGTTWSAHSAPAGPAPVASLDSPESFPFSAASPTDWTLLLGANLFVTHDAGGHWTTITPKPALHGEFGLEFASATDGWALIAANCTASRCANPILVHTTDGGATWAPMFPNAPLSAAQVASGA